MIPDSFDGFGLAVSKVDELRAQNKALRDALKESLDLHRRNVKQFSTAQEQELLRSLHRVLDANKDTP